MCFLKLFLIFCFFIYIPVRATILPTTPETEFSSPVPVYGAGGTNALALDPLNNQKLLIAGDVSGVHASIDGGVFFAPKSKGFFLQTHQNGVALKFSTAVANTVYYLAGHEGTAGIAGLFKSTNSGNSWNLLSPYPQVSATDNFGIPALVDQPRIIGNLIELHERLSISGALLGRGIFLGTINQGLLVSFNEGQTFTTIPLPNTNNNEPITGLFLQKPLTGNYDFLYIAIKNLGLRRITINKSTQAYSGAINLSSAPTQIEEVSGNHSTLIVAGASGVHKSSDKGVSFTALPLWSSWSGSSAQGVWSSIGVSGSGNSMHIWLGCESIGTNNCPRSIIKSIDGGSSFTTVLGSLLPAPVQYVESTTPFWWAQGFTQFSPFVTQTLLGGTRTRISGIQIDPTDPNKVYFVSNNSPYKTTDGGQSFKSMAVGFGGVVATTVAVDPMMESRWFFGMYDWSVVRSIDSAASVQWIRPAQDTRTGRAFAFLPQSSGSSGGSQVFMALSLQENGQVGATLGGSIWSSTEQLFSNTPSSSTWTDEGLWAVTDGRSVGVAVGLNSSSQRILLATVANGNVSDRDQSQHPCNSNTTPTILGCAGIFRKYNQGNWIQVYSSSNFLNGSYYRAPMIWPKNTNRVYVLDRKTGLLASSNAGASFNVIFPLSYTTSPSRTGHLALDPTQGTSRLYLSAGKELRRLQIIYNPSVYTTNNGYGVTSTVLPLPNGASAGPIVVANNGTLYVASPADSPSGVAALFKSTDQGATFKDVSDETYRSQALFPTDMAIDSQGRKIISTWGMGYLQFD